MNSRAAFLVHGFNVSDGGMSSVRTMIPFLEETDITPITVNYGYFGLLKVKFKNDNIARQLCAAVQAAYCWYDEVYVIGHSNGCAIMHMAAQLEGFRSDGFVYINPALKKCSPRHASVKFRHVWHSPSDIAVRLARKLPFADVWGEMGAKGYTGIEDENTVNFNKETDFMLSSDKHSDVFNFSKRSYFGPLIVETMLAHLDPTV